MTLQLYLTRRRLTLSIVCCFLTAFVGLSQAAGTLSVQLNAYHNTQRQKQPSKNTPAQLRFALTLHGQARGSTGSTGRQQLLSYSQSAGTSYTDTTGLVAFDKQAGDAAFQKPFSVQLDDKLERTADLQVTVTATAATAAVISAKFVASATTNGASTPVRVESQNATSPDGNHVLEYSYWFVCLPGSYGPECDRNCVEQDSDLAGHYSCARDTGDKVCLAGWTDLTKDCKTRVVSTPQQLAGGDSKSPSPRPPVTAMPLQSPGGGNWTQGQANKKPGGLNPGVIITIIVAIILAVVATVGCIALFNLKINDDSGADALDGPESEQQQQQNRKKAAQKQRKR